jgi:hypothetical protein
MFSRVIRNFMDNNGMRHERPGVSCARLTGARCISRRRSIHGNRPFAAGQPPNSATRAARG